MGNESLSQEEINILLKGALPDDAMAGAISSEGTVDAADLDAIGEIANISMGAAATALSQILNRKVEITTPRVEWSKSEQLSTEFSDPAITISVEYTAGIEGFNLFILSQHSAATIVDLMMGGEGLNPSEELTEIQISGVAEAMNQMMGSSSTAMSTMFNTKVDITPPKVMSTNVATDEKVQALLKHVEPLIKISFRLLVENVIDSNLVQVIPISIAKNMVSTLLKGMANSQQAGETATAAAQVNTPELDNRAANVGSTASRVAAAPPHETKATQVQTAQFMPLQPTSLKTPHENLELIMDVPLQVSVELGKAKKTIREIMSMGPGSVIELDRLAGETVDMIVNGKLIAKCEVVVINEAFGIRILEIINPADRITTIN